MLERLEATEKKYQELQEQLMQKETLNNIQLTKKISKEIADLEEIVQAYQQYAKILKEIEETKEMLKDDELKEMAKEELISLENAKEELEQQLEILLQKQDWNDMKF